MKIPSQAKSEVVNDDATRIKNREAFALTSGRCNDYPEREYSQVAGSAQLLERG
jgi:hypothetical protein